MLEKETYSYSVVNQQPWRTGGLGGFHYCFPLIHDTPMEIFYQLSLLGCVCLYWQGVNCGIRSHWALFTYVMVIPSGNV